MFYQKTKNNLIPLATPIQGSRRIGAETGSMYYYVGKEAPKGWLFCRGQAVLKSEYPKLYSVIGDKYGSTATTFNLPDLRDYAPAGVGQSSRTDSTHDVYTLGQKKEGQVASHCHSQAAHTHSAANHCHNFSHYHCRCHNHEIWGYTNAYAVDSYYYNDGRCEPTYGVANLQAYVTFTTSNTLVCAPTCAATGTSSTATGLSTGSATIENVAFGATSGGTHGNRISLNVIIYTGD